MKTITKKDVTEFAAISIAAEKLNKRIEKLYNKTDDMNFLLNCKAIQYHSFKLSQLLESDLNSYINK